ncbi:hypothetical protein ACFLYD_07240, partial [Chloroflexota bacterium]
MRFKTAVGQAAMVNGRRHDRADGILVDERASRFSKGRGRGNLYVLVEVSGQAFDREAFAGQLAEVVRDAYYSQQGSVTASLQKAIREANKLLVEENRHSMPGDRQTAGISCAVLRNEDLFLAQAGPAAVYVSHEVQATRFPEISPWLDGISLEEVDAVPMGGRRDVRVDLFHLRVTDADKILLVDSYTARRVSRRAWLEILATSSVEAMREALLAVAEGGDLSALVVILGAGASKGVPAPPPVSSQVPVPESISAPAQEPASQEERPLKPAQRTGTTKRALAAFWTGVLLFLKRLVPDQPSSQQTPRRQSTIVSKSQEGKGAKRAGGETKRRGRGDLLQKLLIVLAIAIPLVVAGIVAYSVIQRNRAQEAELEDLWLEAQAQWVQTQATSDPATVREMLAKAEDSLAQLLERQPDHAGALQLREKIQARLEETSQVRRVHWEGDLATYPANADLTRLVVEGAHLFVMDRKAHSVYHHELDEFQQALKPDTLDTVLVRKGDRVGNILVGDLVDMTWMPVGFGRQKAGLVILDSD